MTGQQRPRVTHCKACGESIIWCETESGKRMPVEIVPVDGGNLLLTPRGTRPPLIAVVSEGGRRPGQKLHRSHFANCRQAEQHRRRPGKQTPQPTGQGELFGGGRGE